MTNMMQFCKCKCIITKLNKPHLNLDPLKNIPSNLDETVIKTWKFKLHAMSRSLKNMVFLTKKNENITMLLTLTFHIYIYNMHSHHISV
jgi:hypothetical protein